MSSEIKNLLYFVTRNQNKVTEINYLLGDAFIIKGLDDLIFFDEIEETEDSFEGNSKLKVDAIASRFGVNCFADDSGLEVDALEGAPGVISARYAGTPRNDKRNLEKVLLQLEGIQNRKARFRTVITLYTQGEYHQFEGLVNGNITNKPKGDSGFGYDPIFVPEGYEETFAEMSLEEKNKISHRAKAINKLIGYLKSR